MYPDVETSVLHGRESSHFFSKGAGPACVTLLMSEDKVTDAYWAKKGEKTAVFYFSAHNH